ncbi:hypothetical protein ACN47E_001766 [Coniothyrium glycines]
MSTCKTLFRACPTPRAQPSSSLTPLLQARHESTTRRHRKLLALPSTPSYTPTTSAPTIIFNPPSSAPNVYHTPPIFLPKHDKRRPLYAQEAARHTAAALRTQTPSIARTGLALTTPSLLPPRPSAPLPSPVRAPYQKTYSVTPAQMDEMRALRAADAQHWTRVRLAEKFSCSQFFVGLVARNADKAERVEREHEGRRAMWGERRRRAREERARRREGWGRDA